MPGLDHTLVKHKLLIHSEAKPVRQTPRRITEGVMALVQEEIHKLFQAGFI